MDVSTPCDVSAAEYVSSSSSMTSAHVKRKPRMHSESVANEEDGVGEFGDSLSEFNHAQELMSDCNLALNEEESCCQEENICEEVKLNQINSLTAAIEKVLAKSATFPCSKKIGCPVSTNGVDEIPERACDGLGSMKSDKPACSRSISLPTSLKLVSAMKGSRERQGTDEKTLTVTWAPDVYDPPVTSLSHTVKGYSQQRSRTSKKNSKHKHKGKSSRGNSERKQYRKHTGNSEPRSKSQATSSELFHQPTVDLLDISVTGQESNCGSSFLRTSAGMVHISFAEAT